MPADPPDLTILEPPAVAEWLDVDVAWVLRAIQRDGMPVLGFRTDGTPLVCLEEVRVWLRRPSPADDET